MCCFGTESSLIMTFLNSSRKSSMIFLHLLDLKDLTDSEIVVKTAFMVSRTLSGSKDKVSLFT